MSKSISKYSDYLQDELLKRHKKNNAYSMRSFARDLGVSVSFLSRVLKGEKNLSAKMALQVGSRLSLKESELQKFLNSVQGKFDFERPRSQKAKPLRLDIFNVISEWFYFPLIELTKLSHFESHPGWIAKNLGISETVARSAIRKLMELDLLIEVDGRLKANPDVNLETDDDTANEAIQRHHSQMLTKAQEALSRNSVLAREFQGLNLAFQTDQLEKAKFFLRHFVEEFNRRFEAKSGDSVYQLNVQFFPLTKETKK